MSGQYILLDRIGFGSYSQVYKAQQVKSQKLVAIKIMKEKYENMWRDRHNAEIDCIKKFSNHPCIIKLIESFVFNQKLHMVFQLLDTNLIDFYKTLKINRNRNLNQSQIKIIAYQTLLALQHIHNQHYSHRDIKPQNILIDINTLQIRLVDFGLTKRLNPNKNTNYIATRWYRSPQLLLDLKYNQSIDTFAFGCVLIQMYLGVEIFQGRDAIDQLHQIFKVVGSPSIQEWNEGYKKLESLGVFLPYYPKLNLRQIIPRLSNQSCSMLNNLLDFNVNKRLKVSQLLKHNYFKGIQLILPIKIKKYLDNERKKYDKLKMPRSLIIVPTTIKIQSPINSYKKKKLSLTFSEIKKKQQNSKWCCGQEPVCLQNKEENQILLLVGSKI